MVEKEIKSIILAQPDAVKARMMCELNSWKWPKELNKFKPDVINMRHGYDIIWPIIEFIGNIIGHKAFLHHWNCVSERNGDKMTEAEFEKWYVDSFGGYMESPPPFGWNKFGHGYYEVEKKEKP